MGFQNKKRIPLTKKTVSFIVVIHSVIFWISASFILYDFFYSLNLTKERLHSMADITATLVNDLLDSNDPQKVEQVLSLFSMDRKIQCISVFDLHGNIFSVKFNPDVEKCDALNGDFQNTYQLIDKHILLTEKIIFNNELRGFILIRYNVEHQFYHIYAFLTMLFASIGTSFLAIYLLRKLFRQKIHEPMEKIKESLRQLSHIGTIRFKDEDSAEIDIDKFSDEVNDIVSDLLSHEIKLKDREKELQESLTTSQANIKRLEEKSKISKTAQKFRNGIPSELLANMSHEIRTPLNAIIGFTDLLQTEISDARQKKFLNSIQNAGNKLLTIIESIIEFSKIEAGQKKLHHAPVHLRSLFSEVEKKMAYKLNHKNMELTTEISSTLPDNLIFDEAKYTHILVSLTNKIMKTTENERLSISAKALSRRNEADTIDLLFKIQGHSDIQFDNIMNGQIIEASHDFIQKPFTGFETDLDFAIVQRLVHKMGGQISVISLKQPPDAFEIFFPGIPIAEGSIDVVETTDRTIRCSLDQKGLVLVVDDIKSNRFLIKELLLETKLEVIEADNGEKAVSATRQYKPDIILMDIRMPVMDGYEATRLIKADPNLQHIPVIALTASVINKNKENMKRHGFDGLVMKPVQKEELFMEMNQILKSVSKKDYNPENRFPSEKISKQVSNILPQVIDKLDSEYMNIWEITRHNEFLGDIESFARQMVKLGDEFSVVVISDYGKQLLDRVKCFDLDNMMVLLDAFPEMVKTLKALNDDN